MGDTDRPCGGRAPRNHSVLRAARPTLAELARHPWVMPWPRSSTRRLVERALEAAGLRARVALEAGGWEIIKRYVSLGVGIAVVPAYCIERRDRAASAPGRSLTSSGRTPTGS